MVDEDSEDSCPNDEDLNPDGVHVTADSSLVVDKYQEYVGEGTEDEEDLDRSVVQGDEICEDIQVAGDENNQEQDLWFPWNSFARLWADDLDEDGQDCKVVGEVSNHSE